MYGAIIGDIVGSRFEWDNIGSKEFELFTKYNCFTDDSVMTIAVGKALFESRKQHYADLDEQLVYWLHKIGKRYPNCGYGGRFYHWMFHDETEPYNSFGNGSAMRTSYCARIAESMEEAMFLAEKCAAVTHSHPEGIKGAQAITACIWLAKQGKSQEAIRQYVNEHYYDLDFTLTAIRETYRFDVTCQGSVPQAIEAFLEADSFEDAIRNAISIGGDSDTIAAMAGSIAEAYYGIPEAFIQKADAYLDDDLKEIIHEIL